MWPFIVALIILILIALIFVLANSIINLAFKRPKRDNDWEVASTYVDETNMNFYDFVGDHKHEIFQGMKWILEQEYKEMLVTSFDNLKLYGRFYDNPNKKGIVLMVHGYTSWGPLDFSSSARIFYEKGFAFLIIDQRAHNNSEGDYITFGVKERFDIKSWTDEIAKLYPDMPIILEGMSMGAATIMMASGLDLNSNVKALIADAGYTIPRDEIRFFIGRRGLFFTKPILSLTNLVLKYKAHFSYDECDTRIELQKNKLPILIVHGKSDNIVPFYMSQENYKAARNSCDADLMLVDDAGHCMSFLENKEEYLNRVDKLLSKIF